ncbi:D-alanyl-D-alanine carboxypeptidase family protein [Aquabacterium sp.]|uniref:D-alanyl-D-alanine carboxypeptidase family protein n=1 Tax=Aquabacterium sp. TaxID=1872578 RepID=UPI0024874F3F|nr:D-alanyl-D-alanine carboxypeptidase family protein [Aquabacterium sp.]MDI1260041.1 D-alanyl-D-alanine carboxypeptidase [Aquabacterium sp.]
MLFPLSRRGLLVALTGALCWPLAWAQGATVAPVFPFAAPSAAMPLPPELAARAFVLQDLSSQQTLAARNADQPVEPASLTKLMTAYLAFQAVQSGKLTLTQSVPVSERAWRAGITGPSRSFLTANSRVKVDDLLRGMIVQSGNDASVVLAEAVGGTVENFVAMMNRQAQAFGLKATTFKNPDGQTAPGHRSTARELSVLALRLVTDFPQALPYYASKEFTFGGIRQPNRNLLLWRDPTVDGLKTSYTDASGYCLIATAQRVTPSGPRRLLSVVIGATSPETRANESQKLLNWGYGAFDMVKLFDANKPVTTAPVWKGQSSSVRLGRAAPVTVVVPRGQAGGLKATVARNDPLVAPLTQGQTVGTLKITLAGQPWQDVPLNTLDAVPSAGWFGRLWDAIRLGVK